MLSCTKSNWLYGVAGWWWLWDGPLMSNSVMAFSCSWSAFLLFSSISTSRFHLSSSRLSNLSSASCWYFRKVFSILSIILFTLFVFSFLGFFLGGSASKACVCVCACMCVCVCVCARACGVCVCVVHENYCLPVSSPAVSGCADSSGDLGSS